MQKILWALAFASLGTAAFAADPVEGLWKTKPDDNGNFGHVQVSACGAKICGVLVKAFNGQGQQIDSQNVGRQLIWDMVPYGNGFYDDGKVYSPDRGKTYNSEMQLSGKSLEVKGCVLGICRSGGTWARLK